MFSVVCSLEFRRRDCRYWCSYWSSARSRLMSRTWNVLIDCGQSVHWNSSLVLPFFDVSSLNSCDVWRQYCLRVHNAGCGNRKNSKPEWTKFVVNMFEVSFIQTFRKFIYRSRGSIIVCHELCYVPVCVLCNLQIYSSVWHFWFSLHLFWKFHYYWTVESI